MAAYHGKITKRCRHKQGCLCACVSWTGNLQVHLCSKVGAECQLQMSATCQGRLRTAIEQQDNPSSAAI